MAMPLWTAGAYGGTETRPVTQEDARGSPEEGVRRAALVMGDPVAHLQAQAQVHLVGHAQGQADGGQRVGLGAADQALGELGGQGELQAPLWNLPEDRGQTLQDKHHLALLLTLLPRATGL